MPSASPYPLSVGRISGLGWSLFKFAWRPLLGAASLFIVPAVILMAVVAAAFSPSVNAWSDEAQSAYLAGVSPPDLPAEFALSVAVIFAASLVTIVAAVLTAGAQASIVNGVFRGEQVSAGGAARAAVARFGSLIGAQILYFLIVLMILIVGFVLAALLVVGGGFVTFLGLIVAVGTFAAVLFVAVRLTLIAQSVMLDGLGATEGLNRSWRLVAGSGWRVLGYLLLIAVIQFAFGLLFGIPIAFVRLSDVTPEGVALGTLLDGAATILLSPVAPLILTLLYFDLRWKQGERVPVPGGGETGGQPELASGYFPR